MNIFLSHNWKDKPIVEPIAYRLKEVYGANSIFYDSWAIKPGEGIIDRMNEGLEKADYFFFFISDNSLHSDMVKLEWQNALMRKTRNGKLKFIPVRLDNCTVPAILTQTLYIDFYANGFEVGIRQIFDILTGNTTSISSYIKFENLTTYRTRIGTNGLCERLRVEANYFMEPTAKFLVIINTNINNINISTENCVSDGIFMTGERYNPIPNNSELTFFPVGVNRALTKENPFIFDIHIKQPIQVGLPIIAEVFHVKGPQKIEKISMINE